MLIKCNLWAVLTLESADITTAFRLSASCIGRADAAGTRQQEKGNGY